MDQTIDNTEIGSVEQQQERDYPAEASKIGWQPEEKFKGDKSKWVDAKTFVERGETVLPIVKHQLRETREELEKVKQAAKEFQAFNEAASKREVDEWKAKYEAAVLTKSEALSNGDGKAFVEAEATQKELEATRPQPKTEVKEDPVFAAWRGENEWYGTDRKRTIRANAIGATLAQEGLRGRELYDAVGKELDEMDESVVVNRGNPQRGGKSAGTTKAARSYENLKPEYREKCDHFVKDFGIKKEQYVEKCTEDMFRS